MFSLPEFGRALRTRETSARAFQSGRGNHTVPSIQVAPSVQQYNEAITHEDETDFSWRKFKKYLNPLPESIAKIERYNTEKMRYGDVYKATRNSGGLLTILPIHIKEWKSNKDLQDALLILGFNEQNQIVGMRSVYMTLAGDTIEANGAVASAICNDGIASALEEVRERTCEQLLTEYKKQNPSIQKMRHTIEDDNSKKLTDLQQSAVEHPYDVNAVRRWEHALSDRPRWITLFGSDVSKRVADSNIMFIYPNNLVENGFASKNQGGYRMEKLKTDGGTRWSYERLGDEEMSDVKQQGILDRKILVRKMKEALSNKPE